VARIAALGKLFLTSAFAPQSASFKNQIPLGLQIPATWTKNPTFSDVDTILLFSICLEPKYTFFLFCGAAVLLLVVRGATERRRIMDWKIIGILG
jgi:hypothetical protein